MIELIPAIDIIEGKCVRLSQGQYESKKVYHENPVEVAKAFEAHGLKRLHLVDLEGAASKHIVNYRTLEAIATKTSLIIDFGGGVKTEKDIDIAFSSGAVMITLGSIATIHPEWVEDWILRYGDERIIVGADVNERKIAIHGWKEDSSIKLDSFLRDYTAKGIKNILCTDISKDGMLQGPSIVLYREILETYPKLYLIASGGVSNLDDLYRLQEAGVPAVVIGKAIYEGHISLKQLESFI